MPSYANNPFSTPQLLQKGVPAYLFGSFSQQVGNTRASVKTDAIATNVATVVAYYLGGPLPVAGSLISIQNSANSAGAFNVKRVAITSASLDATTNLLTIVFPLTGTDQPATADAGTVVVEPAEVGEAIAAVASQACLVQAPEGDSQFTLPVSVTFPTLPTGATVSIQAAIHNIDSEYTTLGTVATVAASAQTVGPFGQVTLQRGYCYRFLVSGLTGSGTIVAKIG